MIDRKAHWDKIYAEKPLDEMSWYQPTPEISLNFIKKIGLQKDAPIIDVGGGDSLLVDRLLELGYTDVTVLDISGQAIERARKRLGTEAEKVDWIQTDVVDFHPKRIFHFWHDRAAFHFLTEEEDIFKYLELVGRAVDSGGYALIGTFSHAGPEYCSGIRIRQYSGEELKEMMGDEFSRVRCFEDEHQTPSGKKQNFIYCGFRRKSGRITVGQTASRSMTVRREQIEAYAKLTGDRNPLHFDELFTAKTKFGKPIVQGGISTGLVSALVAEQLPGPGSAFLSQNWKYLAPVFEGDTITAEAEVLNIHKTKPVYQLHIAVKRQDGTIVMEGENWCYRFDPDN